MGVYEKLFKFLDTYKAKKKPYTNTNIAGGSYNIPDDKYQKFLKLYSKVIDSGRKLFLTEKPTDVSPLRVDLDFRFKPVMIDDNTECLDRKKYYKSSHIRAIIVQYFKIIYDMLDVSQDDDIICVLMQKQAPTKDKDKDYVKDGIHLVFPNLVIPNKWQYYIRDKLLERANILFSGMVLQNDYKSVVDKAIIESNCWQMYGSTKSESSYTYEITKEYMYENDQLIELEINNEEEDDDEDDNDDTTFENVCRLSMRQKDYIKRDIREEHKHSVDKYLKLLFPNKVSTRTYVDSVFLTDIRSKLDNRVDDEQFDLAAKLVMNCLNTSRVEEYDNWIKLGFLLRNIDHRLLSVWDEFSKNSDKYEENACANKWDHMKDENLGMGTLRHWAKEDNLEMYTQTVDNSLIRYVDKVIEQPLDWDMAELLFKKYGAEFKYIGKNTWYKFNQKEHRYKKLMEGVELSTNISIDIVNLIRNRKLEYSKMSLANTDNIELKQLYQSKIDSANKVIQLCKTCKSKQNYIKECMNFFNDDKFEESLNEKSYLIGFNNGVYNLQKGIQYKDDSIELGFSAGSPEDCITFTTGCNYLPVNPNDPTVQEIETFISQVITNKNIREYVLDHLALAIDGSYKQEVFFIFAGKKGSGANGKSTFMDLIRRSLGNYHATLSEKYLTGKRAESNQATPELDKTRGARIIQLNEPTELDTINTSKLKEMTGGDNIVTRSLYKEPFEYKPQFTMIMLCNYVPQITSNDEGTWRRIKLVEFTSRFIDNPNPNNPNEFKTDPDIMKKLDRWRSTFISMLIHRRVMMGKDPIIHEPKEIKKATQKYYFEQDKLEQFAEERIIRDDTHDEVLSLSKTYQEYKQWFKQNTDTKKALDRGSFKTQISNKPKFRDACGNGWKYLRIKTEDDTDESDVEEGAAEAACCRENDANDSDNESVELV